MTLPFKLVTYFPQNANSLARTVIFQNRNISSTSLTNFGGTERLANGNFASGFVYAFLSNFYF
jgi:hypothetical protein